MTIKYRILTRVTLSFIIAWILFFIYLYISLHFELLEQYERKGKLSQERLTQIIEQKGNSLLKISYNISYIAFNEKVNGSHSLNTLQERLSQTWDIFKENHGLLTLNYYDQDYNLLNSWGMNSSLTEYWGINANKLELSFQNRKGNYFVSCGNSCYINSNSSLHLNSLQYGILHLYVPIFDAFNEFRALRQPNITLYKRIAGSERDMLSGKGFLQKTTTSFVESKIVKEIIPANFKIDKPYIIQYEDKDFFIYAVYSDLSEDIFFVFSEDVTKDILEKKSELANILLSSFWIIVLLVGILYFSLNQIIHRLQKLIAIFPDIGSGHFVEAEKKIANLALRYNKNEQGDELDLLQRSTQSLTIELKMLHDSLNLQNDKLRQLADHDSMTGLLNRRSFQEKLMQLEYKKENFFLLNFDLDDFKLINDTLGHATGDRFLIDFADLLKLFFLQGHIVSRMGGDEFAVIFRSSCKNELVAVLQQFLDKLKELRLSSSPVMFLKIMPSIGIAQYPNDTNNVEQLIIFADAAMYENKHYKKSSYNFYTGYERILSIEKRTLDESQRVMNAIKTNAIYPHYQKIVYSGTQEIFAYEVLSRIWEPDKNSYYSAGAFIPYAEKTHLIVQIDCMMFKNTIHELHAHRLQPRLMMNFSNITLATPKIDDFILRVLDSYQYDPDLITLEITEGVEIRNFSKAQQLMRKLHQEGIHFALDDFGAGYSSFNYVSELQFDYLKVDKSIVHGLSDPNKKRLNQHIIEAITHIAKSANIMVIAEGIENKELFEQVKLFDIELLQGYLFAKPQRIDYLYKAGAERPGAKQSRL